MTKDKELEELGNMLYASTHKDKKRLEAIAKRILELTKKN